MQVTIYHNPRCSKSRKALDEINKRNIDVKIIHYLDDKPSAKDLLSLCTKLSLNPWHFIRRKEARFKSIHSELDGKGKEIWAQAMADYPELIERPIVVKGKKALVARDADKLVRFLDT